MRKIILASTSPRRRELMGFLGIPFRVEPGDFEETMVPGLDAFSLAKAMALGKARAVAKKHKDAIVIGADTVVGLGRKVYGKPRDARDAKRILRELSGKTQIVATGLAIIDTRTKKTILRGSRHKVYFRKLSAREIASYVASGEPMGKAGAWAIQGKGTLFIKKIEGDYPAIVGLPVFTLARELEKLGIKSWK